MHVLLINQNATIERLAKLSSGKLGYELASVNDVSEVENGTYGFVIIDSDLYKDEEFGILKDKFPDSKYILITAKGSERPNGFDVYIEKPFLPTELVEIFTTLASSAPDGSGLSEEDVFGDSADVFTEELSIPSESSELSLDNSDELGGLDDFAFDNNLSSDGEISLDEAPTELPDYEEITLDPSDSIFEDSELKLDEPTTTNDELDMGDLSINEEDKILPDEPLEEISLEDYQSSSDATSEVSSDLHDELDLGDDFGIEQDNTEDDSLGDIVISNDEHEVFDSIEGEKSDDMLLDDGLELTSGEGDELMPDEQSVDEMPEISDDVEEIAANEAQIFDEDEINKLKDLLDETEEEKVEKDDFDLENIKIHNDELGSLTEESLAEALGVSVTADDDSLDLDLGSDLDSDVDFGSEGDIADTLASDDMDISEPVSKSTAAVPASNNIEINPNQSITLSLDTIKELLETADVTINITLSKKR